MQTHGLALHELARRSQAQIAVGHSRYLTRAFPPFAVPFGAEVRQEQITHVEAEVRRPFGGIREDHVARARDAGEHLKARQFRCHCSPHVRCELVSHRDRTRGAGLFHAPWL